MAQVTLAVRVGEAAQAAELLSMLDLHIEENPAALRRLNEQRLALAGVYLSHAPPDAERARSLVAVVQGYKPFNGYEGLARARHWLLETPPNVQRAAKACADAIVESRSSASAIPFLASTSALERATARAGRTSDSPD